jgi:hypothetical protein
MLQGVQQSKTNQGAYDSRRNRGIRDEKSQGYPGKPEQTQEENPHPCAESRLTRDVHGIFNVPASDIPFLQLMKQQNKRNHPNNLLEFERI